MSGKYPLRLSKNKKEYRISRDIERPQKERTCYFLLFLAVFILTSTMTSVTTVGKSSQCHNLAEFSGMF